MSQFKNLSIALLTLTFIFAPAFAFAQSSRGGSSSGNAFDLARRVAAREKSRWTLSEWLEQRDRARMMDLWLAFNSPSPYELMLGVAYVDYKTGVDSPVSEETHNSLSGEFSAYAQNFGLTGEYENNVAEKYSDLNGIFNLRLFGNSIQDSFLNVGYGLRTRNEMINNVAVKLPQQFGQASLQLYIHRHFGIDGQYRYFLPAKQETLGDVKGDEWEGGVFIDFGSLRVFGRYFQEKSRVTAPNTTTEVQTDRKGVKSGIKFYF